MSHVSTYSDKITNVNLFIATAKDKGYEVKENVTVNMFGRNSVLNAVAVKLPGWKYDVAIDKEGAVLYDFFGSQKGNGVFEQLGELIQDYNVELIKSEIQYDQIMGMSIDEELNGDKVMTITYAD